MRRIISILLMVLLIVHKLLGQAILWLTHCPKCGYEYKKGELGTKKHKSKYCRGK